MNNRRTVDTIPTVALDGLYHPSEESVQTLRIPKKKDKISKADRAIIENLAKKGCTISEVGTALGLSQNQLTEILDDESHPFNILLRHKQKVGTRQIDRLVSAHRSNHALHVLVGIRQRFYL